MFIGSFAGRFLPTLPYRLGENSPPISTHSPPIGIGGGNFPVTPTVVRPQPQLPPTMNGGPTAAATGQIPPQSVVPLSPLRIRINSPSRINSDLQQHQTHNIAVHQTHHNNGIIQIGVPLTGPLPTTMLHRPFSPSPQPKDVS